MTQHEWTAEEIAKINASACCAPWERTWWSHSEECLESNGVKRPRCIYGDEWHPATLRFVWRQHHNEVERETLTCDEHAKHVRRAATATPDATWGAQRPGIVPLRVEKVQA